MTVEKARAMLARLLSSFAVVLIGFSVFTAPTAYAQDEETDESNQYDEEQKATEEIVVTGSRLKRDT